VLLKHPNARFIPYAKMEKNYILEDQQKYAGAFLAWQGFLKPLQPQLAKPEVQKIYFPGYFYMTRTLYKTATLDPTIKDRPKLINAAAQNIIKLEYSRSPEGWNLVGPMFEDLLKEKESAPLKKEYDRLKALQPKKTSMNAPPPAVGSGGRQLAVNTRESLPTADCHWRFRRETLQVRI
jgi:hypothetical protein